MNINVRAWIDGGRFYIEVPANWGNRLVEDIARQAMKDMHGVPLLPSLTKSETYLSAPDDIEMTIYVDSRDYHDKINPADYPYA